MPSVLWHCWFGIRKSIPSENWSWPGVTWKRRPV